MEQARGDWRGRGGARSRPQRGVPRHRRRIVRPGSHTGKASWHDASVVAGRRGSRVRRYPFNILKTAILRSVSYVLFFVRVRKTCRCFAQPISSPAAVAPAVTTITAPKCLVRKPCKAATCACSLPPSRRNSAIRAVTPATRPEVRKHLTSI